MPKIMQLLSGRAGIIDLDLEGTWKVKLNFLYL